MEKLTDIEKMAKILYRHYCGNATCGNCKQPRCVDYIRAEKLAKECIGDVKQAVSELVERFTALLLDYTTPCFDIIGEPIIEFNPEFYDKIKKFLSEVYGE